MSHSSISSLYDDENGVEGNGIEEESDFYAILNLPKNASTDDINKAYRQKCLIFHPDRHDDLIEKRNAEKYFVKLRKAYETLSDPKLRTIYDTVGLRGLELHGWELIPKSDNAENIRREYEFLKRLRETEIMLQRVHPTGAFVCKTSLVGLLTKDPELRCGPQMTGLELFQSCEGALTSSTKVGVDGRVKMSNGKGDGSCVFHWKHGLSSGSLFENSFTFTPDSFTYGFKYARSIFKKSAIIIQPAIQYFPLYSTLTPACAFIISRSLHPNWQGSIMYTLGFQSSLSTSLIYTEWNQPKFVLNLTVAPINSNVRVVYTKRNLAKDTKFETSCIFSFLGLIPTVSYERRLTRYSHIGCSLSIALPNCMLTAKFKLKTGTSVFEHHLLLCDNEEDVAHATMYGVIIPFVTFHLLRNIFRHTFDRLMSLFEDRTEEREVDIVKREEASNIVSLMRRTAERIAKEEEIKNGLIIVEAKYGQMVSDGPSAAAYPMQGDRMIDVTIPLQAMVNDSQLRIYSGKSQLPGFYDPSPMEPKMLRVVYKYRNRMHIVSVPDEAALLIPMNGMFFELEQQCFRAYFMQKKNVFGSNDA